MKKIFFLTLFLTKLALAEELISIKKDEFLSSNPSSEKTAIVNDLVNQFNGKKVNLKQINDTWNNENLRNAYMLARFQIIDQKLYCESFHPKLFSIGYNDVGLYYYYKLVNYFRQFVKKYRIPNVDFLIYLREQIPYENGLALETQSAPAFIMFKDKEQIYEQDKLIFPDPYFLEPHWQILLGRIKEAKKIYNSWENKENVFFWRGSSTGRFLNYEMKNLDKLDRFKLTLLSAAYPKIINAKITEYVSKQFLDDEKGRALKRTLRLIFGNKVELVKEIDHMKYKYLISVDGNAATGMPVPWIMYSNSLLVKQDSKKSEWFYSALKPYVNYVPLKDDLSDIFDQYEWLQSNQKKVSEIIANANKFIEDNLQAHHIDAHVAILLTEYSKIQQDEKILVTLPEASDWTLIKNTFRMVIESKKNKTAEKIKSWF